MVRAKFEEHAVYKDELSGTVYKGHVVVFRDDLSGLEVEVYTRVAADGRLNATLNIPELCRATTLAAAAVRNLLLEATRFAEMINGTYRRENYDG